MRRRCDRRAPETLTSWQRKELEGDVVGVTEAQARPIRPVNDTAVVDAEFGQPCGPLLQLVAQFAAERDVVKPDVESLNFSTAGRGSGR